ncbi:MAG: hypothetical protein KBT20_09070 [Bacteroidales bacterium]|nr:hypothetical protein [Candidatus Liminaster caballi]
MKKIILSLVAVAVALTASAQTKNMNAFKNVGIGVEAGLMGAGVEVSMPVVSNHLVLVLGYNFPNIKYSTDISFDAGDLNTEIDRLNASVREINAYGAGLSEVSKLNENEVTVSTDAKLNWGNFKAMVEYYPSSKSGFHFTLGAMIGNEEFISLNGVADEYTQAAYTSALKLESEYSAWKKANASTIQQFGLDLPETNIKGSLRYNIDETSYGLGDRCAVDAAIKIQKVKPYFGIGFGRAIPNKRVGFQFEIGAWYHGTPKIESTNELDFYDENADGIEGVGDTMSKIQFYPQMTFRLTGRIF